MKLRWSETARRTRTTSLHISLSVARSQPKAVASEIMQRARRLSSFPLSGPPTAVPGVRSLSIVKYPYVVLYVIDHANDEIIIRNIRHTARKKPAADDPHAG